MIILPSSPNHKIYQPIQ